MVMVVRGQASLGTKLRLLALLGSYGFSADVRSPVDSWTPLLAAVELGCLELVTALTKIGGRLSADRHLGFTPLHLACQMGHWHLVPFLTEAMQGQLSRVAAWGPSPQYVSLNLVDAYGRTALDIALLRYFASPLPCLGTEHQKAVDILREFVHRSPPEDPGVVCGWELLRVLRFLDALPSKKSVGAQFWGADWESPAPPSASIMAAQKPGKLAKGAILEDGSVPEPAGPGVSLGPGMGSEAAGSGPYSDTEELLQAVRVLVRAGAQTRWLLQDLVQPPPARSSLGCCGAEGLRRESDAKEVVITARGRGPTASLDKLSSLKYSPIEPEDIPDWNAEDGGGL
jgi:hypothetical protein